MSNGGWGKAAERTVTALVGVAVGFAFRFAAGEPVTAWWPLAFLACGFALGLFIFFPVFHARKRAWIAGAIKPRLWIERATIFAEPTSYSGVKAIIEVGVVGAMDDRPFTVGLEPLSGRPMYLGADNADLKVRPLAGGIELEVRPHKEAATRFDEIAKAAQAKAAVRVALLQAGQIRARCDGLGHEVLP